MKEGKNSRLFSSISSTLHLESEIGPIKCQKYVLSLSVKPRLKTLLSVLRYRLPRFRCKGQNQKLPSDVINRSKSID